MSTRIARPVIQLSTGHQPGSVGAFDEAAREGTPLLVVGMDTSRGHSANAKFTLFSWEALLGLAF